LLLHLRKKKKGGGQGQSGGEKEKGSRSLDAEDLRKKRKRSQVP